MPLRALVFDLWGTLLGDSVRRPYEEPRRRMRQRLVVEALVKAGAAYPEERIAVALQSWTDDHAAMQDQQRDIAAPERVDMFLDRVEAGLARRLSPDALRAVEDALVTPGRVLPPDPAPGAHEALQEAQRRGLALGLISNTGITPGYVLREVLADDGLLPYLQVLTFSDEARLAKPAAGIFRCTLEALGIEPADAVFIGDMPALDVVGPKAVGMWSVQVGHQQLDGVHPHARIDALPDLFPALERLGLLEGLTGPPEGP